MILGNNVYANLRTLDYTVIGDTVNITTKLKRADTYEIIITENAYQLVKGSYEYEIMGLVNPSTKSADGMIYKVIH